MLWRFYSHRPSPLLATLEMLSHHAITTDAVEPNDRLAFYREQVCQLFVALDATSDVVSTAFRARIVGAPLGPIVVDRIVASRQEVARTMRLISRQPADEFKLSLQVSGRAVLQQDRAEVELGPGDLVMYDTSRPYTLRMDDDFVMVVAQIQRGDLHALLPHPERGVARLIDGRQGMGACLAALVSSLHRAFESSGTPAAERLGEQVVEMLAMAMYERVGDGAADSSTAHFQRARAFILSHLSDADLSNESIAAAVHLSASHLYEVFRIRGTTPAAFVLQERLNWCRKALASPQQRSRSITQIAHMAGFRSSAQLSRTFRRRYDLTPRDYRESMRGEVHEAR